MPSPSPSSSPSVRHHFPPFALLAGALWSLPASAAPPEEGLQLLGGIGWAYDDNLLRQADSAPAFGGQRSDTYSTLEAGVVYNKHISRQRIAATAKVSKVAFDHFDQLDYNGRDLQATWSWELGNAFEGRAEALYIQTLAPYTDFNSDERNLRQRRRQAFDAGWKMHPSYKLRVGAERDKTSYDLLIQRANDRTEKAVEAELLYQPKSGSALGLVARRVKGSFPYRRPYLGSVVTDDFTQDELKLRVNWLASGASTVQALAGYVRREQPSYGKGATSGVNGRINAFYTPRGKIGFNAAVWREFAPIESLLVSDTLNKGASIGAHWAASAKLTIEAHAAHERRAYTARIDRGGAGIGNGIGIGNGAGAGAGAGAGRDALRDAIRSASVRAVWQVRPKVQVVAAYVHQARSGSALLGTGRFDANLVQVSANALF